MANRENAKTMRIDLIPEVMERSGYGGQLLSGLEQGPARSRDDVVVISATERARYEHLFNGVYDGALLVDCSGAVIDANLRATELLGYAHDEFLTMWVDEIVNGLTPQLVYQVMEHLEQEQFSLIQAYCVRSNRTFFSSEISASRLAVGGEWVLCLFVRDTSLRREAEEKLLTEHNAIQNAADGIAVADRSCHIEYVNPAVSKVWGYSSTGSLIGADVGALFDDPGYLNGRLEDLMSAQNRWTGEALARHADGSTFPVRCSAVCNRNSEGQVVGVVIALTDLTARMEADRTRRENEQQRVMLESLGAACHHLGQPATVLIASLGLLARERESMGEEAQRQLDRCLEAGQSLTSVMHRLNEFNEYRTTQYLAREPADPSLSQTQILDV